MSILNLFNTRTETPVSNVENRSSYNPSFLQELTKAVMNAESYAKGKVVINEQSSMTIAAVFSAVKLLSELTASLTIFHQKKDGNYYRNVTDSAVSKMLKRPAKAFTSYNWMQTMLMRLLLRGNAYAFISRQGSSIELIPIYDKPVDVKVSPDGTEVFYYINGTYFANYEMLHFRGMSLDGFVGISPIQYAARELRNAIDMERYMNKLFESGIMASGFFTTAERLSKASYERMKSDIESKSGIDRAGEARILDSGLKFERNTLSAADSQIIEWAGFSVEEVARIYRVPKHLLYLDAKGGSTRSFSTQAKEFLTYSLSPLLNNVEEEIGGKIINDTAYLTGAEKITFDTKTLLRSDPKERADYYRSLFSLGSIKPDEIRAEEGYEPIDGGDSTYIQLNLAPLGRFDELIEKNLSSQQQKAVD